MIKVFESVGEPRTFSVIKLMTSVTLLETRLVSK